MSTGWREYRIRPQRNDPKLTYVLVALVAMVGVVSSFFPALQLLMLVGTTQSIGFEYWRLPLYVLTSGNLLGTAINAAVLYFVTRGLEGEVGGGRLAGLFVVAGTFAAGALVVAGPLATLNGAFCGVFGIFAGYAVMKHKARMDIRPDIILLTLLVVWTIVSGGRDWVGQIAAIVAGAALGAAWSYGSFKSRDLRVGLTAGGLVALAAVGATAHWLGVL